jgi:hypothetical protein
MMEIRPMTFDDVGAGARMHIIERGPARGFVVHRDRRLLMLGATDDRTAAAVFWQFLAEAGEAEIWGLTARQNWAVKVAIAARLEVAAAGAVFLAGREHPPGPGWAASRPR